MRDFLRARHKAAMLAEIPQRYRIVVLVAIETGVRWGELAAVRPLEVDLDAGEIHVRRVVLEVSKKITGADSVWTIRDYPEGQRAPHHPHRRRALPGHPFVPDGDR
jgi:integrase